MYTQSTQPVKTGATSRKSDYRLRSPKRESIIDGRGFRVLPAIETVLGGSKSRDRRTAGTMGGIERPRTRRH
jgi:hypothetical protein